jgi:hypothetical protein
LDSGDGLPVSWAASLPHSIAQDEIEWGTLEVCAPPAQAKRGWIMSKWLYVLVVLVISNVPPSLPAQSAPGCPACGQVEKALEDFGHLKAGMMRRDAARYFALDGGMNFRGQTRYVYKKCEFIQIDINFEEDPDVRNDFSQKDKITNLSKLFLAFPSRD